MLAAHSAYCTTWQVGPSRTYTLCSQVAPLVQHGDTVAIDAALYTNDKQVQWSKNNLFIHGVGGRPTLQAGSLIANDVNNGKGIFVVSGSNVCIENIALTNATVPDHNGAGIRQEGANLRVRYCKFDGNEMGILSGNIANCKTIVEYCEFLNGGSPANPGYQHNIYINHIDILIFQYNYSYNAIAQGHEFKSRAHTNFILYNTISNYLSEDSRNIDLPNGGTALIMGNVIEQGPNSSNSNMLGYGKEGLSNPTAHELYVVNNTFVNKKTTGSFIDINTSTQRLVVKNNIFAGAKTGGFIIGTAGTVDSSHNLITDSISACGFVAASQGNYHLTASSPARNTGTQLSGTVGGYSLVPDKAYRDTCGFVPRTLQGNIDRGAFEYATAGVFQAQEAQVTLYPNPSHGSLTLTWPGGGSKVLQVYSMQGHLCAQLPCSSGELLSLAHLKSGCYTLRLSQDSEGLLLYLE